MRVKEKLHGKNDLEFVIFCVENLAVYIHKPAPTIYNALKASGILEEYIIPCYDVLHTQGKEYIVEDILSVIKKRGVEI